MSDLEPTVGPLQLLLVGFETTERFHGDIARELRVLRGRGVIRVLDARLFHRAAGGKLTEIDLNPLLAEPQDNPIAHLLGANGAGATAASARRRRSRARPGSRSRTCGG